MLSCSVADCLSLINDLGVFLFTKDWRRMRKMNPSAETSVYSQNIVRDNDQEIPQSQTADNPMAPRGRATQPSRDTRKTNQAMQQALSSSSR